MEKDVLTQGAEMGIDGDWERGRVWLKKLRTDYRAIYMFSTDAQYIIKIGVHR